ncbi:alpha/beta hydrolase family esterase [Leeuwenhoekiella sp. NPDC079379]|uniref:alpha/beta hydrolase family esterase n=1 Tax=Leeuwenhoekiella sp. NPDC079379 TaxID=3364122 RepID=UPI0037CB4EB0
MNVIFRKLLVIAVLTSLLSCKSNVTSDLSEPKIKSTATDSLDFSTVLKDSIEIDQNERTFSYFIPNNITENPKLIFVLHGSNGSGDAIMRYTENWFNKLSQERKNAIIVYPDGYKQHWNECRKEANFDANVLDIDDIAFFKEMIAFFNYKYAVKKSGVFVAGHSNGGHMVYKLAKELPEFFAKYAAVSASLPVDTNNDCINSSAPVSIMILNGTGDSINPYEGGEVNVEDGNKRGEVMSTRKTIEYWANLAGLDFPTTATSIFPDLDKEDGATAVLFKATTSKYDIQLVEVKNGGHLLSVPTEAELPTFLGNNIQDINMAQLIYDFFIPAN